MNAELAIKRVLDGTFTQMLWTGSGPRANTRTVSLDFMPDYAPAPIEPRKQPYKKRPPRRAWSAADDETLRDLRVKGVTLKKCAAILERSTKQLCMRMKLLEAA